MLALRVHSPAALPVKWGMPVAPLEATQASHRFVSNQEESCLTLGWTQFFEPVRPHHCADDHVLFWT